jgi:hypothetical protein
MSLCPITPLVRRVQGLILATFEVSEQVAQDRAVELVALAEGWGSPETAAQLDWSYRIKKDLGARLPWKTDADRQVFQREQEERYTAYDFLITKNQRQKPGGVLPKP